jgi:hypothetical protein
MDLMKVIKWVEVVEKRLCWRKNVKQSVELKKLGDDGGKGEFK